MANAASSGELEGYLKKKSPKTQGKKMVDVWQKRCDAQPPAPVSQDAICAGWHARYFVLAGGELKYYKTEKQASTSDGEALKVVRALC